jgi:hypothetical protein
MALKEPELIEGYHRDYLVCKRCCQIAVHDYVPYSLSSAIRIPPCSHDLRDDYKRVSRDVFMKIAELRETPDGWTSAATPPKHGGRVQVAFILTADESPNIQGPFVDVSRYDCDKWEFKHIIIAWKPQDTYEVKRA